MWLLAAVSTAQAQQVTKEIRFCVDVDIDLVDHRSGDWWTDNGTVVGRGLRVFIPDDTGGGWVWLDSDGCKDVDVTVTSGILYNMKVKSKAKVNGVTLEAFDGSSAVDPTAAMEVVHFPLLALYSLSEVSVTVPEDDNVWNLLAVASWAMQRNTMNLGTYSDRDCCHDAVDADGSCVVNPPWIPDWYSAWGDAKTIRLYNEGSGSSQPRCCDDTSDAPSPLPVNGDEWCDENDPSQTLTYCECHADQDEWCEAAVGVSSPLKFLIAHELGHVVTMKRMGQRAVKIKTAPLHGCMGDYNNSFTVLVDNEGLDKRGEFTQEYHSTASREGWANFYSAWLWNKRVETDCVLDSWKVHDIDLDGDLDNNYDDTSDPTPDTGALGEPWDGRYGCDGSLIGIEPRLSDPLGAYADGLDWLALLYHNGSGEICWETGDTGAGEAGNLEGLGSVVDWMRFWWDMTKQSGGDINPATLADVYVDMCPSTWAGEVGTGDKRVIKRLEISADHHGVDTEWATWKSNGQDH